MGSTEIHEAGQARIHHGARGAMSRQTSCAPRRIRRTCKIVDRVVLLARLSKSRCLSVTCRLATGLKLLGIHVETESRSMWRYSPILNFMQTLLSVNL